MPVQNITVKKEVRIDRIIEIGACLGEPTVRRVRSSDEERR